MGEIAPKERGMMDVGGAKGGRGETRRIKWKRSFENAWGGGGRRGMGEKETDTLCTSAKPLQWM